MIISCNTSADNNDDNNHHNDSNNYAFSQIQILKGVCQSVSKKKNDCMLSILIAGLEGKDLHICFDINIHFNNNTL